MGKGPHRCSTMTGASGKTKRSVLIFAIFLIVLAVIWLVLLESNSYLSAVSRRINSFGYSTSPSEFYTQGYGDNTNIAALMSSEPEQTVQLSKQAGFEADVQTTGFVELLLWNVDNDNVMYIWLLNHEPQIVFIEDIETGQLKSIG